MFIRTDEYASSGPLNVMYMCFNFVPIMPVISI